MKISDDGLSAFESFVADLLMESNIEVLRLANLACLSSEHLELLSLWINDETSTIKTLDLSYKLFNVSFTNGINFYIFV